MDYKQLTLPELQEWFSDFKFKIPLYHHQLVSLAFALGEQLNNVMFLHGIGTGKTLTALSLIQILKVKKTLIICPKSVIKTWKDEIKKHTDFSFIELKDSREQRLIDIQNIADLYIINYEGLRCIGAERINGKYKVNYKQAESYGFECVICDESHHLKDPLALQTKIAAAFSRRSRYNLLMTGTPIGKNSIDVFGQFLVLDSGKTFGTSYYDFLKHYYYKRFRNDYMWLPKRLCNICNELYTGKKEHLKTHNIDLQQYRNQFETELTSEEIIMQTASRYILRYTREECLDLPEKVYEVKEVMPTNEQQNISLQLINGIKSISGFEYEIEYHTQKLVQITGGFLYNKQEEVVNFSPNPKLIELEEILKQIDNKFIIYHQYIYESNLISNLLKKMKIQFEVINGQTKDKEKYIANFIDNNKCRGLIAHPKSGGEGLNLQIANTIIYYSNGYIGTILREQSEGRIHRAGQTGNCLFVDIIMQNTIDEILYNSLKSKEDTIKNVLEFLKKTN